MSDERRNLPSASAIPLFSACKGAYLLSKQVPESEKLDTEDSRKGDRVHLSNETGDLSILESMSEEDLVIKIRNREEQIFNQWIEEFGIKDAEIHREKRLWMGDQCSGKLDFLAYSPAKYRALIIDAKSGRMAVTPTPRNLQLRTQAVLVVFNFATADCRVAIAQPMTKTQPVVDYNDKEIRAAWFELIELLNQINDPAAPRTPGNHCSLCEARHICPEARQVLEGLVKLQQMRWLELPIEQRVILWEKSKLVVKIAEQIQANIRSELRKDPLAYAGYLEKRPDTFPRVITSVISAYNRLAEQFPDLPTEELQAHFNEWCDISIGKIEEFRREKYGGTKEAATAWLNKTMAGCLGTVHRSGAVVRVKEEKVVQ